MASGVPVFRELGRGQKKEREGMREALLGLCIMCQLTANMSGWDECVPVGMRHNFSAITQEWKREEPALGTHRLCSGWQPPFEEPSPGWASLIRSTTAKLAMVNDKSRSHATGSRPLPGPPPPRLPLGDSGKWAASGAGWQEKPLETTTTSSSQLHWWPEELSGSQGGRKNRLVRTQNTDFLGCHFGDFNLHAKYSPGRGSGMAWLLLTSSLMVWTGRRRGSPNSSPTDWAEVGPGQGGGALEVSASMYCIDCTQQ